ncbi:hypothetical protein BsWGS_24599 [Bradybaena similaris]
MAALVHLIVSCLGAVSAATSSQQTYYRVWADYGVERIGQATKCLSAPACAVSTQEMYPEARSFMFNPFLNMCLPGGRLSRAFSQTGDAEGYLYVQLKAPQSLAVVSQDEATACIGIFDELLTYDAAAQRCQGMGYFLASVKNLPKLRVLVQLAGARSLWVGCDDGGDEGKLVWKEDGSILSDDTISAVFSADEPNDYLSQDCCLYRNDTYKLDDYDCSVLYPYACEVSLDNCNL